MKQVGFLPCLLFHIPGRWIWILATLWGPYTLCLCRSSGVDQPTQGIPGGQVMVTAFVINNPKISPRCQPLCLTCLRRSSCMRAQLISMWAAQTGALQSWALCLNKTQIKNTVMFLQASHPSAPYASGTLVSARSPANGALLICPTDGSAEAQPCTPKPEPVSSCHVPWPVSGDL